MSGAFANPVVHLELWTANLSRTCAFYRAVRLGGRDGASGRRRLPRSRTRAGIRGGVVERENEQELSLPDVEVADINNASSRAGAERPSRGSPAQAWPAGEASSPRRLALRLPSGSPRLRNLGSRSDGAAGSV